MGTHTLDVAAFRVAFPVFVSDTQYPDAVIQSWWNMATCYVDANDNCGIFGDCLQQALNLMTAHLGWSDYLIQRGQTTVGVLTGSTIDKVSVSLQAPPMTNGWQAWLATTPYGMRFWALMSVKAAGGWYVGGSPERSGFRKVGGFF